MYIDSGEVVRLRVEADDFCDDEPGPTKVSETAAAGAQQPRRAPYVVCVNQILLEGDLLLMHYASVRSQSRVLDLLHGGLVHNRSNRDKMIWTKARLG